VIAMLIALSGCGFESVYGSASRKPGAAQLREIEVEPIANRNGQILRNHLIDMFDPLRDRANKRFVLRASVTETPGIVTLRRDNVISRGGYSATVSFQIYDRASGRQLVSGGSTIQTDFEIADSEYSTRAARENARERVMQILAEEVREQISAQVGNLTRFDNQAPPQR